jgi:hypothetical protein
MTFFRSLFSVVKAHPLAFVGFLVAVVLLLGGLVWKLIALVAKVPFLGSKAAAAAETIAGKTGSA